jgi:hypothetical protein
MSYYDKLILMNNNTIFVILLLASPYLNSTLTMLPAAHAEGGDDDDHDKRGDGNKQRVEEDGAGAIADCDWNDIEESDFRCIATAATDEGRIIRDGGTTPPPPPPTDVPFTVTGEGSEGSVVCDPPAPDVEAFITFSAQGDGTVTGTYTFSAPDLRFVREGVITEGTTDGQTYTLSGENESVCGAPPFGFPTVIDEVTISGDCGDDVQSRMETHSQLQPLQAM